MRPPRPINLPLLAGLLSVAPFATAAPVSFNRDIRPILSDNCFHCHGPDKKTRDSGLRLDIREEAMQPAKSGDIAIVPGKPDESQLVVRILSDDKDEVMPPPKAHKTLTAAQKDLLKRWIAEGAKYEAHWAYTPVVRPEVPRMEGAGTHVRTPIDAFIQQRLAEEKIQPSAEADRRTLIRRLSLDLIGIPPTPQEVEAFEKDAAPDAYERLVERLLASPQYGERMAQQWLDVARYADTVGFHGDQNQNVWVYRDWVINAFNSNKPFDQFTIEQLAGDLLPNPTVEQRIATCFNRLNMVTREGGAQPKEYLAKYTIDRVRTVGTAWLGSTLGCAECHDHKFDPWSQKDIYSIGAFFSDVKQWGVYMDYSYTPNPDFKGFSNDHPFPPEITVESDALKRRIAEVRQRMTDAANHVEAPADKLAAWQKEIAAFLKKNPKGWETPKARITATSPKPEVEQGKDGRVVVDLKPTREFQIELAPSSRLVAAIKLELLPDAKYGNKILRGESTETQKPVFEVVRKQGDARAVAIRHAEADHYAPRYSNGYELTEVQGVQGGWKLDPKNLGQAHTAVYLPDQPVALEPGETLRVKLSENLLGSFRVSTSPLAPVDIKQFNFPDNVATLIADSKAAPEWYLRATGWNAEAFAELKRADVDYLACRGGKTPVLVTERTDKPLTVRVLPRGNWQDESGEICPPSTPHFLPKLPNADGRQLTRLDLAKWLVSAENPLTARVIMNRLWRQFFGNGLSAQVDDVGAQGEPPSHPELLDWLASEFRERGWDMKQMIREIVTSHTYRQVAGLRPELRERDPQNRLLASQNPRRLDAEFVRDNALAIAGLLNLEMGGPACKPYQPDGYYDAIQFPSRKYTADNNKDQWRRGVYMHWQRTFLHPMLANFDAPSREDCFAIRTSANSPQQALTLLNDPEFVEAARVWAGKLLKAPVENDGARIDAAYQQALARKPKDKERESLLALLTKAREEYRTRPDDAPKLQAVGIAPAANGDAVELAAWTTLCRVVLNLHETITRY